MRGPGYANLPCNLNILKENNILYSWNTIRVGKKCDLLDYTHVSEYAIEYLLEHPKETDQFIVELACCEKASSINDILDKVADIFNKKIDSESDEWELEMRKLRFCVLIYVKNHIFDRDKLLNTIAMVYNDFGFPEDMKNFIYYMPSEGIDLSKYSKEERLERLVNLFKNFLINEKNLLTKI